jgi:hypothetical protein
MAITSREMGAKRLEAGTVQEGTIRGELRWID